jgi:hypothetical protein
MSARRLRGSNDVLSECFLKQFAALWTILHLLHAKRALESRTNVVFCQIEYTQISHQRTPLTKNGLLLLFEDFRRKT